MYTLKKSKRLADLTNMEKDIREDNVIPKIGEYVDNILKLSVEDLSPMAITKLENALVIDERITEVYGDKSVIGDRREDVIKLINDFEEIADIYPYAEGLYMDKQSKVLKNAYTEFADEEFYLRDQLTANERGMLSEFAAEGLLAKNKFKNKGIKLNTKKSNFGMCPTGDEYEYEIDSTENEYHEKAVAYKHALDILNEDGYKKFKTNKIYDSNEYV